MIQTLPQYLLFLTSLRFRKKTTQQKPNIDTFLCSLPFLPPQTAYTPSILWMYAVVVIMSSFFYCTLVQISTVFFIWSNSRNSCYKHTFCHLHVIKNVLQNTAKDWTIFVPLSLNRLVTVSTCPAYYLSQAVSLLLLIVLVISS